MKWIITFCPFGSTVRWHNRAVAMLDEMEDPLFVLQFLGFIASFWVKPRRKDKAYRLLLVVQFMLFIVATEVLEYIEKRDQKSWDEKDTHRALLHLIVLYHLLFYVITYRVRTAMASLSDGELSKFLVDTFFIEGLRSMLILVFFMFEPLRCIVSESGANWGPIGDKCDTVLTGQPALSYFIGFYTLLKVGLGAVPRVVLREQNLTMRKVLEWLPLKLIEKFEVITMVLTAMVVCCLLAYIMQPNEIDKVSLDEERRQKF